MTAIQIEYPTDWTEYELLDSGDGEKLERFGPYIISRPDPRAIWQKSLSQSQWEDIGAKHVRQDKAHATWKINTPAPDPWLLHYRTLTFTLRPTEFKHVGIFPEQAVNWDWIQKQINGKPLKILNLFAYTGGATIAAALAGATATHVDSVKSVIAWAKNNADACQLETKYVRWIEDDVYKFVLREGRRGSKYDGIIMDPPRFGRGTKGEVWKLEDDLPKLLSACKAILSPSPTFFLLNAYTADISSIALDNALANIMKDFGGTVTSGELALKESASGRLLPSGLFTRWSKG